MEVRSEPRYGAGGMSASSLAFLPPRGMGGKNTSHARGRGRSSAYRMEQKQVRKEQQSFECSQYFPNDSHSTLTALLHTHPLQISNKILQSFPLFLSTRQDLTSRQYKPIRARIPQLKSQAILSLRNIPNIISTRTTCRIQRTTTRSSGPCRSTCGFDCPTCTRSECINFSLIGGYSAAVVAVGCKDVLPVGVPVDIELDALGIAELVDKCGETFVFGAVTCCFAAVGFVAGVCG